MFCPPQCHVIVVNVLLHRIGFDRSVLEVGFRVYLQCKCPAVATDRIGRNSFACANLSNLKAGKIMIYGIHSTTSLQPENSFSSCTCRSQIWPILYHYVLVVLLDDDVSSNYLILHEHTFCWSYSYLVPPHRSNLFQYKFWNIDFVEANSHCAQNMVWFCISLARPSFAHHWIYAE